MIGRGRYPENRRLGPTIGDKQKKAVVEGALRMYAESVDAHENVAVFDQTSGAWQRQESPSQTVKKARQAFHIAMKRHAA